MRACGSALLVPIDTSTSTSPQRRVDVHGVPRRRLEQNWIRFATRDVVDLGRYPSTEHVDFDMTEYDSQFRRGPVFGRLNRQTLVGGIANHPLCSKALATVTIDDLSGKILHAATASARRGSRL